MSSCTNSALDAGRRATIWAAIVCAPMAWASTSAALHAYVDPGAAGFVVVSVLGFLSALGYAWRARLSRLRACLRELRKRNADGEPANGEEGS